MAYTRYRLRGRAHVTFGSLPATHPNGKKYRSFVNMQYKKKKKQIRCADIYFVESTPVPASTIDADGNIEMFVIKTDFDLFLRHWQSMRRLYIEYDEALVSSEGFSIVGWLL